MCLRDSVSTPLHRLPPGLEPTGPSCPAQAVGGRIPETRGAFFLLLGGRASQVFELPLACSLSSHHSVAPDPETGLRCQHYQDTPPLKPVASQEPGQPFLVGHLPGRQGEPWVWGWQLSSGPNCAAVPPGKEVATPL